MSRIELEIVELLERISRVFTVDQYAEGLKPVQWETLRYLNRANRFSRIPGALTAYLGVTKGTVSQTIIALERKGYVRKDLDAQDRRIVRLELSESGEKLLAIDPAAQMLDAINSLTRKSQRDLAAGLKDLLRAKLDTDGKKPFGICATCKHFRHRDPNGAPHRCALLEAQLSEFDAELICVEHERAA